MIGATTGVTTAERHSVHQRRQRGRTGGMPGNSTGKDHVAALLWHPACPTAIALPSASQWNHPRQGRRGHAQSRSNSERQGRCW